MRDTFMESMKPSVLLVVLMLALVGAGGVPAQDGGRRGQATGDKRVALVIGNSAYKEAPLRNPVNDARAMADKLRQLGFHVIARENATKAQMEKAVAEFGDALGPGAIGLFYYAGHGMQVSGRNFLIPVDATIHTESRVRLETLDVDLVLDQMDAAKNGVNIVILDACRNNPFERRFRSVGGGLAQINAPQGTLIAYATAPGRVAADGEGANGLYTERLLQYIGAPGLPIEEVFKRVRNDVARQTNSLQTPWESSSLTGSFYFATPPAPAATPAPAPAAATAAALDREIVFWQSVMESDDPAVIATYLRTFPDGTFAELAKAKIASIERRSRTASAAPAPAPAPVPAATAPPARVAAIRGAAAFDGVWRGSYACGPSALLGFPGFRDTRRVFVVTRGELSGAWEYLRRDGLHVEERFRGSVSDDGRISITGTGSPRGGRDYRIAHSGEIREGRLKARGHHADRVCTLDYHRVE
jgi:hypothetical protein